MDLERLEDDILRLNEHFRETGDPARARYVYVDPGRAPRWYVVLRLTLEMPPPDDPEKPNCWLHETHMKYRELLNDFFSDHDFSVSHHFRTAEQLAASPPRRGVRVPESAEHISEAGP